MSNYASSFRLKMQKFIRHSRSFREKKNKAMQCIAKKNMECLYLILIFRYVMLIGPTTRLRLCSLNSSTGTNNLHNSGSRPTNNLHNIFTPLQISYFRDGSRIVSR
uniref:Uncharacterized protein n=1 Tax=Zea mays TaxID=4577 RepID=A0A804MXX3_MAIZE